MAPNNENDNTINQINPYSILNVPKNATPEEIQKSYKTLSRTFHPDKQQQQQSISSSSTTEQDYQEAQKVFIQFKNCHDVLLDPVLRLGYDLFGHDGVLLLKRSLTQSSRRSSTDDEEEEEEERDEFNNHHDDDSMDNNDNETNMDNDSADYDPNQDLSHLSLYHQIETHLQNSNLSKAKLLLCEAMQYTLYQEQNELLSFTSSADVKVQCHALDGGSVRGGGGGGDGVIVDKTKFNLSVVGHGQQSNSSGGTSTARDGTADSSGGGGGNGRKNPWNIEFGVHGSVNHEASTKLLAKKKKLLQSTSSTQPIIKKKEEQKDDVPLTVGDAATYFSVGYEPCENTDISLTCEVGGGASMGNNGGEGGGGSPTTPPSLHIPHVAHSTLKLETSRSLSHGTFVSSSVSTVPQSNDLVYSFASHRSLSSGKYIGKFVLSFDSNLLSNFALFIVSTGKSDADIQAERQGRNDARRQRQRALLPRYTFRFALDQFPLGIAMDQNFSTTHSGHASLNLGIKSMSLNVKSKRALSKYCNLILSLSHVTMKGLSTTFSLQRGSWSFSVPIKIATISTPNYVGKSMFASSFMLFVDSIIESLIDNTLIPMSLWAWGTEPLTEHTKNGNAGSSWDGVSGKKMSASSLKKEEERFMEQKKKLKEEALQQVKLMTKPAQLKRMIEEKSSTGLVIMKATYGVVGGDEIDVTVQLQFWVVNSYLYLPPTTTKSTMLGFYDVSKTKEEKDDIPMLTVRYTSSGNVYEITVLDHEELTLPSEKAMLLGDAQKIKK